jgi:hypothetical protein
MGTVNTNSLYQQKYGGNKNIVECVQGKGKQLITAGV